MKRTKLCCLNRFGHKQLIPPLQYALSIFRLSHNRPTRSLVCLHPVQTVIDGSSLRMRTHLVPACLYGRTFHKLGLPRSPNGMFDLPVPVINDHFDLKVLARMTLADCLNHFQVFVRVLYFLPQKVFDRPQISWSIRRITELYGPGKCLRIVANQS